MPTPEIIAHRGASGERPENSLAAFARALELGADGVELDVHLTADDVLVVHHDPRLRPSTPDAPSPELRSLTRDALRAYRAFGEPIPTLEEVLALAGSALTVYCELKGSGTAIPACRLLQQFPATASAVHSFDHRMVAEALGVAPGIPRGVLETSYHLSPTQSLESVRGRDLWQYVELVDEALVRSVHEAGGRVIVWTVNTPTDMERLAAMGVDGLCTNHVSLARRVLGR